MKLDIPPTLGLLSLSLAATGCSDARKIGEAYEAICKANCECPEGLDAWNDVGNCKNACEGYGKVITAEFADRDDEPCKDIDDIASKLEDCAKKSCATLYECAEEQAYALYECWPGEDYYGPRLPEIETEVEAALEQLPAGIPQPILREALYSAFAAEFEAEAE